MAGETPTNPSTSTSGSAEQYNGNNGYTRPPVFEGENFEYWKIIVQFIFIAQDLKSHLFNPPLSKCFSILQIVSAPFVVTELDLGLFMNCVLNECQKTRVVRMFQKSGG